MTQNELEKLYAKFDYLLNHGIVSDIFNIKEVPFYTFVSIHPKIKQYQDKKTLFLEL